MDPSQRCMHYRVNGREMLRIQGVYMYVINRSGQVGAILGFHPMVVVVYEDTADREAVRAYLRVDRWIYPLSRSFAPVYVWGPDKMIFPDPFSTLTEPIYIVVRLPIAMSKFQKDTLWNLIDIYAHLRGSFSHPTVEEIKAADKRFALTEFTANEQIWLDKAQEKPSATGTESIAELSNKRMRHKLNAMQSARATLSVCFKNTNGKNEAMKSHSSADKKAEPRAIETDSTVNESFSALSSPQRVKETLGSAGGSLDLKVLPAARGNTMRIYLLGPRDPQHIFISTVMEWVPVSQLMLSAVEQVFSEQIRLRKEKELAGLPPTFQGHRSRLFGGFGSAGALNEFGVCKTYEPDASGPYMDLSKVDPSHHLMFHKALSIQNLEAAAEVFDYSIDRCELHLLSFAPDLVEADRGSIESWLGSLVPRDLVVRYRKRVWSFARLLTLSATVNSDLVHEKHTNYIERIHEDCEHHYPKLRPRNPLLDPKYPYPRLPSPYGVRYPM